MMRGPFWIKVDSDSNVRLATADYPRKQDFPGLAEDGVDVIISMLPNEEMDLLALGDEAALCDQNDIELFRYPIDDHGVPAGYTHNNFHAFALDMAKRCMNGDVIITHCFAGIGRSSLMAASIMCHMGYDSAATAFKAIQSARGVRVPDTVVQLDWVTAYFDMVKKGRL